MVKTVPKLSELTVVIKGAGEMASAVAWRFYMANIRHVLLLEIDQPAAVRRKVAFCEAVYDGRLYPEPDNQKQRLVLTPGAHAALRPTGIRFVPMQHDGCSQRSPEEAAVVHALYASLLEQSYVDRKGRRHHMSPDNILVVAPYNMQVNLLKQTLPADARVGTVDKFQGQEAEVVIVSMATSSGEYLPRFMEFLYSKNRLNVALSRARCLALVVASPALMTIKCNTIEQMELVNTVCWLDQYSNELS